MAMQYPSQQDGRTTYTTKKGGGNMLPPGLVGPVIAQTAPGFEQMALISRVGGMLPYLSIAFHENTQQNIYVLLLDQKNSEEQGAQAQLVSDGDLALVTLGPTPIMFDADQNPIPATIVYSESEVEAEFHPRVNTRDGEPRRHGMAGFPFDNGMVLVLSSTPGRVTLLPLGDDGFAQPGARFTARVQNCG